jgi:hypothetical protein
MLIEVLNRVYWVDRVHNFISHLRFLFYSRVAEMSGTSHRVRFEPQLEFCESARDEAGARELFWTARRTFRDSRPFTHLQFD